DAALVPVDELDRVFNSDYVPAALAIDLVDHRGKRGGLSASGGTRDEHQPARLLRHLRDHARKSELVEALDLEGDLPDDHGYAAALLEAVAAKPRQVGDAEREVQLVFQLESLLLVVGKHRVGNCQRILRREHVLDSRVRDLAVYTHLRPFTGRHVQIRRTALDHFLEQRTQVYGGSGWRRHFLCELGVC